MKDILEYIYVLIISKLTIIHVLKTPYYGGTVPNCGTHYLKMSSEQHNKLVKKGSAYDYMKL